MDDSSHTNINISASNLSGIYINLVFISSYTENLYLKPPKGYSNGSVSLSKALLQWLANCSIKDS